MDAGRLILSHASDTAQQSLSYSPGYSRTCSAGQRRERCNTPGPPKCCSRSFPGHRDRELERAGTAGTAPMPYCPGQSKAFPLIRLGSGTAGTAGTVPRHRPLTAAPPAKRAKGESRSVLLTPGGGGAARRRARPVEAVPLGKTSSTSLRKFRLWRSFQIVPEARDAPARLTVEAGPAQRCAPKDAFAFALELETRLPLGSGVHLRFVCA